MKDDKFDKKLWSGRFNETPAPIVEKIGESISFDKKLYKQDIQCSKIHSQMLERIGILTKIELEKILNGLDKIQSEIENDIFHFSKKQEDIHMHIENRLTELVGNIGKKLHTARSRNDQVVQDVRIYIDDSTKQILSLLYDLLTSIYKKSLTSIDIFIPGYTHLQVAQPIRVSHYLLSYFWMFKRDFDLFHQTLILNSELVLGSGALAGVNYPTDSLFLKKELKLRKISENSIDAVSSRDNLLSFLFACSQFMIHASRFCEEMIVYSSVEFSFIKFPDSLTTGSSIMPQKKNPDIAELVRGKTARVVSNLNQLLILLKGIPLAYNRDLQEDKIALFDSQANTVVSLEAMIEMIKGIQFIESNTKKSLEQGFATATDLADFLVVEKNIPFRKAHDLVGNLVSECIKSGKNLYSIEEKIRILISEHFQGKNYFKAISLSNSCDKKKSYNSTAKDKQIEQLKQAEVILKKLTQIIELLTVET